jgi:hypothetical protein
MAGTTNGEIFLQSNLKVYRKAEWRDINKEKVLDHLFKFESFANDNNEYKDLNPLLVRTIVKETSLPDTVVLRTALKFLAEASQFTQNLSSGLVSWGTREKTKLRQARFYLRRAHKIAPVFDYSRAIVNLEILHSLLKKAFYWPRITTQLALTIFVTDRNDPTINKDEFIMQKNLRAFCACSAYAFHMARKKLKIDKAGSVNF